MNIKNIFLAISTHEIFSLFIVPYSFIINPIFSKIVLVFLTISLYFDIQTTLGLYFLKINNTLATVFVFWLIHQSLIPLSNIFQKLEKILTKALVLWISKSLRYLIIFLGILNLLS